MNSISNDSHRSHIAYVSMAIRHSKNVSTPSMQQEGMGGGGAQIGQDHLVALLLYSIRWLHKVTKGKVKQIN